jgi:hypothetical protein
MVKKVSEAAKVTVETSVEESKSLAKVISDTASDACTAASNAIPAAGKLVRKAVYNGFYFASYGVTYGSMAVASLIPSESVVGEGIHDGAAAARQDYVKRKEAAVVASTASAAA